MLCRHRGSGVAGRLKQWSRATISNSPTQHFQAKTDKTILTTNLLHVFTHPQHPCKHLGRLRWYIASALETAKGEHLRCTEWVCRRSSCLACFAHCLSWLLSCCCTTGPHTETQPQNLKCPTTEGKSLAFIASQMLGTQRITAAEKTSLNNDSLLVLVCVRARIKPKGQTSQEIKGTTPLRAWGKIRSEKALTTSRQWSA